MSFAVNFGDPPCSVSNDHYWHGGSVCASCGERLRCICGRFVREDEMDAHFATCVTLRAVSLPEETTPNG